MVHTGKLKIPLTNDYMFKALMQENESVLKGLLCSLLSLKEDDIVSTEITNSIILGDDITDKTFMLDVCLRLNDSQIINLEMQVIDYHNWTERSLAYLGREFSKILKGDDYENATPVHQIGILNFTLFEEHPMFYSTYMMQELKNHHRYSDKFAISVLDLTQIDKATVDDKARKLDQWARLFSAKTWEDLTMLTKENPIMADAVETLQNLTDDDAISAACYRRDLHMKYEAYVQRKLKEQADELKQKSDEINQQANEIAELKRLLAEERAKNN